MGKYEIKYTAPQVRGAVVKADVEAVYGYVEYGKHRTIKC